jgi:hypothetical protein
MPRGVRRALVLVLACTALAGARPGPLSAPQAAVGGLASFEMTGEGLSPLRIQVRVTNRTARPLQVRFQPGVVLASPQGQDVMVIESRDFDLPPRGAGRATLGTLCVDSRSEAPPGPQPRACTPQEGAPEALHLWNTCLRLAQEGRFPDLPIVKARQAPTVAQLALWARRGEITREEVRQNVFAQLDLTEKEATPEQRQEVERGVDNVWQAVDLTLKESAP